MNNRKHISLVIPGPVEVRQEVLRAQTQWMIGHRSSEFAQLFARLQHKLKQAFLTENRVYVIGGAGTGLWEAASRNCIRDGRKALHLVNGAFGARWAEVSRANGKQVDVINAKWGQACVPEMVEAQLEQNDYDAVCVVHNETSTGVINPIKEIGDVVHRYDDTLLLVDAVSSFLGAEVCVDEWGIDVALTSSQKGLALPPGLALAAVSDRVLERAKEIEYRGYYFDFLVMEKSLLKNNAPATPPISLMFAADMQLDDILAVGLEQRWQHHLDMCDVTHKWALEYGFSLYAQDGYRSPTVTAIDNRQRGIDVNQMAAYMRERGFAIDKGYGKIKEQTFRIAHLGDMSMDTLNEVLGHMGEFVK